ncbi:MAG TPA: cation transporter [Planktothrix sp.]|jgi:divalent metal cation (Fe/Co/Zn/Cd) transporter
MNFEPRAITRSLSERMTNAYFVMTASVIMIVLKATAKIVVGFMVASTMIVGDGFHNIADALEATLVIVVLIISLRPKSQKYSLGRGNLEFFASGALGIVLAFVAVDFFHKSVGGLALSWSWLGSFFSHCASSLAHLPGGSWLVELVAVRQAEHTRIAGPMFGIVLAITVGSLITSLLVSRMQIRAGRASGHSIVSAAGEEMRADSRIELVTVVGIICEKLFPSLPWIEFLFAGAVAFVVGRTAVELLQEAYRALCAHTIGLEIDEHLRKQCRSIPGVIDVPSLGTFRVGPLAVVKVVVHSLMDSAIPLITDAIERQSAQYVKSHGFLECHVDVTIKRPEPDNHRSAFAVRCDERGQIVHVASTLDDATHVVIADSEFAEIERATLHVKPADVYAFLRHKRVRALMVFDGDEQSKTWMHDDIPVVAAVSYIPAVVGLVRTPA